MRKSILLTTVLSGGGGVITPASYSGLTSWLDASLTSQMFTDAGTTPVSADGNQVFLFRDLSAVGNHFTQATAGARPLYKTNRLNGKSGLLFQGTDDVMASNAFSAFYAAGAKTIIVVLKNIAGTGGVLGDASGYFGAYMATDAVLRFYNYDGTNDIIDATIGAAGTAAVVSFWQTGGNIYTQVNAGAASSPVASGNTAVTVLTEQIGSTAGLFGNIDLYERATYNVALADADRNALVAALMTKWGIA